MLPGVYLAKQKNGTIYYRSNINFSNKHISLGSFSTEEDAHAAYLEASVLLADTSIDLTNYLSRFSLLSHDKVIVLLNFRDNHLYFKNPIYLRKGYFSYYLSASLELKFDIDDLFYYASHKIQRRQGHLFVNDYGMQYSILSRYGIRPYAVANRDYQFANGDDTDFRYSNLVIINHYHGVFEYLKNGIISATISQNVPQQMENAFEMLVRYLINGEKPRKTVYTDVQLVLKSNMHLVE